jgi:hypothetical protein
MSIPQSPAGKRTGNTNNQRTDVFGRRQNLLSAALKPAITTVAGAAARVSPDAVDRKNSIGKAKGTTTNNSNMPPIPSIPSYMSANLPPNSISSSYGSPSTTEAPEVVITEVFRGSSRGGSAGQKLSPVKPPPPKPVTQYTITPDIIENPIYHKWNLPPHKWSQPTVAKSDVNFMPSGYAKKASDDKYRRGRIWWKANPDVSLTNSGDSAGSAQTALKQTLSVIDNYNFGFQFLWNPEAFSTGVAVTMEATPNVNDQWLGAAGLFPATETIGFTIFLDRTNDFAFASSLFGRPTNLKSSPPQNTGFTGADYALRTSSYGNDFINMLSINEKVLNNIVSFYKPTNGTGFIQTDKDITEKLKDLYQRGTLADLEFLYRAINGKGTSSASGSNLWRNPRGIATADIGWLMPSLVNIDIGPLSYVGWVTNISVNHTGFTQDMIPIRSAVTIAFNLLATAGVSNKPGSTN